jgi:hypothetical protein
MPPIRIASACVFALMLFMGSTAAQASRKGLYPVTLCGPGLAYFCRLHGFFDGAPFRYNLAIYPGCIKWVRVETPYGWRRQRVIVCG